MSSLSCLLRKLSISNTTLVPQLVVAVRNFKYVEPVKIGIGVCYRRKVHYPEEYTVKPLEVTNLAGRHPKTGRIAVGKIGGGIKHKYHWIDWKRVGPKEGPPQEEKVIKIMTDGCRTAHIALVAIGEKLKYILASENMKAGDILRTSMHIPRIPVRANEGDAYPLGALPLGTIVHSVEMYPGEGGVLAHAAGTFITILRKAPDDRVVVKTGGKRRREFALPQECMCTVGRVSNVVHSSIPIGSAQRNRELGNRPKSGLWHRKDGHMGRKLRRPSPTKVVVKDNAKKPEIVQLTLPEFKIHNFQRIDL